MHYTLSTRLFVFSKIGFAFAERVTQKVKDSVQHLMYVEINFDEFFMQEQQKKKQLSTKLKLGLNLTPEVTEKHLALDIVGRTNAIFDSHQNSQHVDSESM